MRNLTVSEGEQLMDGLHVTRLSLATTSHLTLPLEIQKSPCCCLWLNVWAQPQSQHSNLCVCSTIMHVTWCCDVGWCCRPGPPPASGWCGPAPATLMHHGCQCQGSHPAWLCRWVQWADAVLFSSSASCSSVFSQDILLLLQLALWLGACTSRHGGEGCPCHPPTQLVVLQILTHFSCLGYWCVVAVDEPTCICCEAERS
jgi:hypothetical protein